MLMAYKMYNSKHIFTMRILKWCSKSKERALLFNKAKPKS